MNLTNLTNINKGDYEMYETDRQFLQKFLIELALTVLVILGTGLAIIGYIYACMNPASMPGICQYIFGKLRDIGTCYKQFPNGEDIEINLLPDIADEEGAVPPQHEGADGCIQTNVPLECSL